MKELTQESCIRQEVDVPKLRALQEKLRKRTDLEQLADLLAMAGNETRLKILYLLAVDGELCVCDIADVMSMKVSAISHQLRKLRDRKVIQPRREGPTIFYRLTPGLFQDMLINLFRIQKEVIFHEKLSL